MKKHNSFKFCLLLILILFISTNNSFTRRLNGIYESSFGVQYLVPANWKTKKHSRYSKTISHTNFQIPISITAKVNVSRTSLIKKLKQKPNLNKTKILVNTNGRSIYTFEYYANKSSIVSAFFIYNSAIIISVNGTIQQIKNIKETYFEVVKSIKKTSVNINEIQKMIKNAREKQNKKRKYILIAIIVIFLIAILFIKNSKILKKRKK